MFLIQRARKKKMKLSLQKYKKNKIFSTIITSFVKILHFWFSSSYICLIVSHIESCFLKPRICLINYNWKKNTIKQNKSHANLVYWYGEHKVNNIIHSNKTENSKILVSSSM